MWIEYPGFCVPGYLIFGWSFDLFVFFILTLLSVVLEILGSLHLFFHRFPFCTFSTVFNKFIVIAFGDGNYRILFLQQILDNWSESLIRFQEFQPRSSSPRYLCFFSITYQNFTHKALKNTGIVFLGVHGCFIYGLIASPPCIIYNYFSGDLGIIAFIHTSFSFYLSTAFFEAALYEQPKVFMLFFMPR